MAHEHAWLIEDADNEHHSHHHYRSIFISDVHLGTRDSQADQLAKFLKFNHAENLYLVGDIIDGWAMSESRTHWAQSHTNVIRRILTKSKRGTKVIYITGNHDEFLRKYTGLDLGNIVLRDEVVHVTADGERIWVIHGDQFDGVIRCHKWLAHVGDWAYGFALWLNRYYNAWRARFGKDYWSLSAYLKHRVKKAVNYISQFETLLADACREKGLDGVLCGHIHHAEIQSFEGVTYYNTGDWVESCTAIVEDFDGTLRILKWAHIGHTDENTSHH
jgi:UDP-2,3-diacylglucosamine pyrophosphatase LpxH